MVHAFLLLAISMGVPPDNFALFSDTNGQAWWRQTNNTPATNLYDGSTGFNWNIFPVGGGAAQISPENVPGECLEANPFYLVFVPCNAADKCQLWFSFRFSTTPDGKGLYDIWDNGCSPIYTIAAESAPAPAPFVLMYGNPGAYPQQLFTIKDVTNNRWATGTSAW
jgi:hypothetical protein